MKFSSRPESTLRELHRNQGVRHQQISLPGADGRLSFRCATTLEPGVTPNMITINTNFNQGATVSAPQLFLRFDLLRPGEFHRYQDLPRR